MKFANRRSFAQRTTPTKTQLWCRTWWFRCFFCFFFLFFLFFCLQGKLIKRKRQSCVFEIVDKFTFPHKTQDQTQDQTQNRAAWLSEMWVFFFFAFFFRCVVLYNLCLKNQTDPVVDKKCIVLSSIDDRVNASWTTKSQHQTSKLAQPCPWPCSCVGPSGEALSLKSDPYLFKELWELQACCTCHLAQSVTVMCSEISWLVRSVVEWYVQVKVLTLVYIFKKLNSALWKWNSKGWTAFRQFGHTQPVSPCPHR